MSENTSKVNVSFWNKPIKNIYLKWASRHGTEVILWVMAIIIVWACAIALDGRDVSTFNNQVLFTYIGLTIGLICGVSAIIVGKQNQILLEIEKIQH